MSYTMPSLGVQDALDDIEMELLQDAVQRDDLGQSVQNVRSFQNDARKETLDAAGGKPDYRAIATRQFQLNDMLLTLLQEIATRQRALELDLRLHNSGTGAGSRAPDGSLPGPATSFPPGDREDDERARPSSEALVRRLDAIQGAMRDDALALQLEVTPNDAPVFGRLIGNMRATVHSLVVFYANQLGARQTEINRIFGGALQGLMLEQERDRAQFTAQVQALAAEVAALRSQAPASPALSPTGEEPPPP
jgi:hypothetical protein